MRTNRAHRFFGTAVALSGLLMAGSALAQSQTAQSIMVSVTPDNSAYQIDGTIT